MRILVYSDIFGGTTTTFIYNEVIRMKALHHVKYACIRRENPETFPFDDVEVLPFDESRLSRSINWRLEKYAFRLGRKNKSFAAGLQKIIRDYQPDVIHCHFAYEALRIIDNLADRNIPIVITFQGYDASQLLNNSAYVRRLNEILGQPKVFPVFVSDFLRQNLLKAGVKLTRSKVIYGGIDTELFHRSRPAPAKNPFVFLQVSSFAEKKGHIYTVRAFKRFLEKNPDENAILRFAGAGMMLDDVKKLVADLSLTDKVDFIGKVTPIQARDAMQDAHCFIHHSVTSSQGDTEGLPNALKEAMAMELPVLSTLHAGIPELVQNEVNGFLVAEKDIQAYAEVMKKVMDWELSGENRKKILSQCSFETHISELIEVYGACMTETASKKA